MSENYPYPEAEHYQFPRNQVEQAREELRLYPDPESFRRNLVVLRKMYGATNFMQAMQRYSIYAEVAKIHPSNDSSSEFLRMNFNFFSGCLMAVHTVAAPLGPMNTRHILACDPLASSPDTEDDIRALLDQWISGEDEENSWYVFIESQDEDYQEVATAMAERLYDGRTNHHERELDFLAGFTLASNLVWQAQHFSKQFHPPI